MLLLIASLTFLSVSILAYLSIPMLLRVSQKISEQRQRKITQKMDAMYIQSKERRLMWLYVLAPLLFGGAGFFFATGQLRLLVSVAGVVVGFLAPGFYIKMLAAQRKKQFYNQLIDALMMMNSSLKGGLSLLQAMEVVADEMPPPISQEFVILIGENKMGVALETSLERLYNRMKSSALQQFVSSVLLARETGGNLPIIFNRIIGTIRENKKIQQNIETLTLQGKLQGLVMSFLPVGFGMFIYSTTPEHFNVMTETELGRNLLVLAAVLQVVGTFLIIKISQIKEI